MNCAAQSKPWFMLGVGALGSLWACHLLNGGITVSLIVRNADRQRQLAQAGGITAIDPGGKRATLDCGAVLPKEINSPIEQCIIACKAHQSAAAWRSISTQIAPGATVVLLQNGMGVAEKLLSERPDLRLLCAVSRDGAHSPAPFTVQLAGCGGTDLGRFPSEPGLELADAVARQLAVSKLEIRPQKNIYETQWRKLAVNCVINPLTALYRIRNGELHGHRAASALIPPLCREIAAVSTAQGIPLSEAELKQQIASVCRQTAANFSSMLQDVRHRRHTEIAHINGYLLQIARSRAIRCPANARLFNRIIALSSGADEIGIDPPDPADAWHLQ